MTARQRWVLVLTSCASLMVALDVTVVSTALSSIRLHLGASVGQLEWTVNAYGLSFAVLLMTASALGDRFGRRRLFVAGLVLFAGASAACALAQSVGWLIAARAVQGVGAAVVAPTSLALLSSAFAPEQRARALGIYSGITGLAVLGGPIVGGAVTQGLAWQWIFWLNVPIGLAAAPLVLRRLEESHGRRVALDLPGLGLVTAGALGIVWGLVRGNAAGWASAEVLGALVLGCTSLAALVAWELRARTPMLPMRLFGQRAFAAGNLASLLMFGGLFSAVFFMAQYLQTVLGVSPLGAGLRLVPWTGTVFFVAPIAGGLVNRVGERPLIIGGLLLQATGLGLIGLLARPGLPYAQMIGPLVLAGVGISMAIVPAQNAVVGAVAAAEIGTASGTFSTMRQLGGALGLALAVAVFTATGGYRSAGAFSAGFGPALGVSAALSLCGALAGAALHERRAGGQPAAAAESAGAALSGR